MDSSAKKLNVGCGRDYREGWVNVDVSYEVKADHYFDIVKDFWPFPADTFSEIYCSGVLEQILQNDDLVGVMNEMHRVIKPSGTLTVIVPNARYSNAFRDPHDVRQFTPETFEYFKQGSQEHRLYGSVYGYKSWWTHQITTNARGIMTITMAKFIP